MKNRVDFLPEDYLERKAQQRTNAICLVLFLLVAAGVGAGFFITDKRQSDLQDRREAVDSQMNKASEALKQLELLEQKKKQMMSKASVSAMLMEPVPRSLLLATITNNLPKGVSLLDYKLNSEEIKSKQPSEGKSNNKKSRLIKTKAEPEKAVKAKEFNTTIEFTGQADNDLLVAELIDNLGHSPLFQQVNLVFSEDGENNKQQIRRFALQAVVDPQARASENDVKMAQRRHIKGM